MENRNRQNIGGTTVHNLKPKFKFCVPKLNKLAWVVNNNLRNVFDKSNLLNKKSFSKIINTS